MRLRHVITRADAVIRDFANHSVDVMIVGNEHVKGLDPRPTHKLAGGWKYRLDLVQLEGAPCVKISATHEKFAPTIARERFFPFASFKEINPWLTEDDDAEERELGPGLLLKAIATKSK